MFRWFRWNSVDSKRCYKNLRKAIILHISRRKWTREEVEEAEMPLAWAFRDKLLDHAGLVASCQYRLCFSWTRTLRFIYFFNHKFNRSTLVVSSLKPVTSRLFLLACVAGGTTMTCPATLQRPFSCPTGLMEAISCETVMRDQAASLCLSGQSVCNTLSLSENNSSGFGHFNSQVVAP